MQLGLPFLCLFFALVLAIARGNEDDEVKVEILTPPPVDCERKSKKHDQLSMHYVGTLTETGVQFDSSHERNKPFEFQLGTGQVIQGWEEGVMDMCVGEKRKLVVPASLGYGEEGIADSIPANAGLTFEVELMEIKDGQIQPNVFKEIDSDGDKHLSEDEVSQYLKKHQDTFSEGEEQETTEEQHRELIDQIFKHEDKDMDRLISFDEFSGPKHDEL